MNEDIEVYLDNSDSTSYIESLAKTRAHLNNIYKVDCSIMTKLDALLEAEIELAILGAEKAKSEILKAAKNKVRPIK